MILALSLALLPAGQDPAWTRKPVVPATRIQRVRIVQGEEQLPVAGAEVRWLLSKEFVGISSYEPFFERRDPALARASLLGRSDERGELDVPLGDESVLLELRAGNLWGVARFDDQDPWPIGEVCPLELRPDFDVRVRVVGAQGTPLGGVPVCARHSSRYGDRPYASDELLVTTDAQGSAFLKHAGYSLEGPRDPEHNSYSVAIAGCLSSPVEVPLDYAHPPTEVIELRMPPTGVVELAYEDGEGHSIAIQGLCAIVAPSGEAERDARAPLSRGLEPGTARIDAPGSGPVYFPRIGLGAEWIAWVQRNRVSEWASVKFRGPREPGEIVRVVLQRPAVPHLRGTLADAGGGARAGVALVLETREFPPSGGWKWVNAPSDMIEERTLGSWIDEKPESIVTDACGTFELDFPAKEYEGGELFLVVLENAGKPEERSARMRIDKRARGDVDLGVLKLEPSPVLAAGRVVDKDGNPLAGVGIGVSPEFKGGDRYRTTSLVDGSFVVRGVLLEKSVELNFHAKGFAALYGQECKPGSRDLEITLVRSATLRGHARVPESFDRRKLAIGFSGKLAAGEGRTCGGNESIKEDGSFAIELEAGTYAIDVLANDGRHSTALRSWKDVVLRPGETKDLGELAVDSATRQITLRLVDPDGKEPSEGWVALRRASRGADPSDEALSKMDPYRGKDLWKSLFRENLEHASFTATTDNPFELFEAAIPGYRFVHLENVAEDRTIELVRGMPVKLKLTKKVGAPLEGCTFHVGLVSKGEPPRKPYQTSLYRSEPFGSDGTAVLLAPDPGTYWIQWIVERKVDGGSSGNTQMDARQQLVILDQKEEQLFELEPGLDPSKVDPGKQ
jgi:hypothetical protein